MSETEKEACLLCLQLCAERLRSSGEKRLPQRSDFTAEEVVAIKAHLGPWPRALEAAGLKAPRTDDRLQKNREKRIRAKRNLRRLQNMQHRTAENETDSIPYSMKEE